MPISLPDTHKLKIFTWHIHGTYLYYLSHGDFTIYIPVDENGGEGYWGRGRTFPFGENVIEIPAQEVKHIDFDCILFQSPKNFLVDQYEVLSEEQRSLPAIYVEHNPPLEQPTDTRHPVNDPRVVMVHVTYYNQLMWKCNARINTVIEHGVPLPSAKYRGHIERGIVVVNHLHQRGRRLGADIFEDVKKEVPLDLVGMGTEEFGGLGEVMHGELPAFISQYRLFFNPIRYTSFGLAVCEAMLVGMPVVALATTEHGVVIRNGINGVSHTNISYLVEQMQLLLQDRELAEKLGAAGRKTALELFDLERFTRQWKNIFELALNNKKDYAENSIYQ